MDSLISQRTPQSGPRVEPIRGGHPHAAGSVPRNGKSHTPLAKVLLLLLSFTVPRSLAQVEYSQRYAETTQAHSLWHLLSEAHILLRASFLQRGAERQSRGGAAESQQAGELDTALKQNCAQLGDCFNRSARESPCKQPSATSPQLLHPSVSNFQSLNAY